jgi:predicted RNA binding protein YcfA (HicA-like mRNA interferase family)
MTALEAERLLLQNQFIFVRSKGSHRIYQRDKTRIVVPFHSGQVLHPKIVRQIENAIQKNKDLPAS